MRRDDYTMLLVSGFSATPIVLLWITEEKELVFVRVFGL